jgi:hypothetical protein
MNFMERSVEMADRRKKTSQERKSDININQFVNRLVVDDEKEEKREIKASKKAQKKSKLQPSRPDTSASKRRPAPNGRDEFLGRNVGVNNPYGDEYYDRQTLRRNSRKRSNKQITKKSARLRRVLTCILLGVTVIVLGVVL